MSNDAHTVLERFRTVDAFEARLVVRRGTHYVLLVRRAGTRSVRLELGSEAAGARLSVDDAMRARLGNSGYARLAASTKPRPWAQVLPASDPDGLFEKALSGLDAIGAAESEPRFELTIEPEAPPDNPKLIEAMRDVARSQDVASRQRLYAALVNATLMIPLDPASLDAAPDAQQPLVVDEIDGQPVIAAFSDAASLRSWRHAGHPWAGVHGASFFTHAERASVAIVRINPGGAVGGELYRNEVEAISEGVRRFQARSMN